VLGGQVQMWMKPAPVTLPLIVGSGGWSRRRLLSRRLVWQTRGWKADGMEKQQDVAGEKHSLGKAAV